MQRTVSTPTTIATQTSNPRQGKWASLWRIARTSPTFQGRIFATAEMVCIVVSNATILLAIASVVARLQGVELPSWWSHLLLPLLTAGSIGYFTNFIAVTMLFRPYACERWHWVRWITLGFWREGLIPKRKNELANSVGTVVSERLLTPEMITEEIRNLVAGALEDSSLRENLRFYLGPVLRQHLPTVIQRLSPEILSLLRQATKTGTTKENLVRIVDKVIEPWLLTESSRDRLADTLTAVLREQTPRLVAYLRQVADGYRQQSFAKRLFLGVAETLGGLHWDDVDLSIRRSLGEPATRRRLIEVLADVGPNLRQAIRGTELEPVIDQLGVRVSDYAADAVESFLDRELPEVVNRLMDSRDFWNFLSHEMLPKLEPQIRAWLGKEGVRVVGERFDVAGRVRSAIEGMDVEKLHEAVDQVSAEQLGAIQVLGFAFGLAGGVFLLLVW